jgi:hypothetical protein
MREYERLQSTQEKFIHDLHYKSKSMLDLRNDGKSSLVVMSPEPSSVRFRIVEQGSCHDRFPLEEFLKLFFAVRSLRNSGNARE